MHVRQYSDTYGEERISCISTPNETSQDDHGHSVFQAFTLTTRRTDQRSALVQSMHLLKWMLYIGRYMMIHTGSIVFTGEINLSECNGCVAMWAVRVQQRLHTDRWYTSQLTQQFTIQRASIFQAPWR